MVDCFQTVTEARIPNDWQNSILLTVFKGKGDPTEGMCIIQSNLICWRKRESVRTCV